MPAQHYALDSTFDDYIIDKYFTVMTRLKLSYRPYSLDYLLPALRETGFDIPVTPEGAFYLYADCSRFTDDSYRLAQDLLEQAGVAITPGIDFGIHLPQRHVRFAYTTSLENLQEGVRRLRDYLKK